MSLPRGSRVSSAFVAAIVVVVVALLATTAPVAAMTCSAANCAHVVVPGEGGAQKSLSWEMPVTLLDNDEVNVPPGGTVCFDAALDYSAQRFIFHRFFGTEAAPIRFAACGARAVTFTQQSSDLNARPLWDFTGGSYFLHIDGASLSGVEYGLRFESQFTRALFPVGAMRFGDAASNFEVNNCEFTASDGFAIDAFSRPEDGTQYHRPTYTMYRVHVHHNYVHDSTLTGAGFRIGYWDYEREELGGRCHNVVGLSVHHNRIENVGELALEITSAIWGYEVHDNTVVNWGRANKQFADHGIRIGGGSRNGLIRNNAVHISTAATGNGNAIEYRGYGGVMILDNTLWSRGNGIYLSGSVTSPSVATVAAVNIWHNTIWAQGERGITNFIQTFTPTMSVENNAISFAGTADWQCAAGVTGDFTSVNACARGQAPPSTWSLSNPAAGDFEVISGASTLPTKGKDISSQVPFDFKYRARSTTPTYGAYEYAPASGYPTPPPSLGPPTPAPPARTARSAPNVPAPPTPGTSKPTACADESASTTCTADDWVRPYPNLFAFGANVGSISGFTDEAAAALLSEVGVRSSRPALFEHFLEQWGYDIRVDTYNKMRNENGYAEIVPFIGYPSDAHRDTPTSGCGSTTERFANMYTDIWDGGANDTPVNDNNYYALYVFKLITAYKGTIRFVEVFNEPDYVSGTTAPYRDTDSWWTRAPACSEMSGHQQNFDIFDYVRMLRITWEVVKSVDPSVYVTTGGIGWPSFLDAILRYTDKPGDGAVTSEYPRTGGAYFDVVSYHCYAQYSVKTRADYCPCNRLLRNSDRAALSCTAEKMAEFNDVLAARGYGPDATTTMKKPMKIFIATEHNVAARAVGDTLGGEEVSRNYIAKFVVRSMQYYLRQAYVYVGQTAHADTSNSFDYMGLFKNIAGKTHDQALTSAHLTAQAHAYNITSRYLLGRRYDAVRTEQGLGIPTIGGRPPSASGGSDAIAGGAFLGTNGADDYTYVLWAMSRHDNTEEASATFTFPTGLSPAVPVTLYAEDVEGNVLEPRDTTQPIVLTSMPIFLSADPLAPTPAPPTPQPTPPTPTIPPTPMPVETPVPTPQPTPMPPSPKPSPFVPQPTPEPTEKPSAPVTSATRIVASSLLVTVAALVAVAL